VAIGSRQSAKDNVAIGQHPDGYMLAVLLIDDDDAANVLVTHALSSLDQSFVAARHDHAAFAELSHAWQGLPSEARAIGVAFRIPRSAPDS
jgi:hypothetical protein